MRLLRATSSQVLSISKDGNATFMVTSFLFLPRVFLLCMPKKSLDLASPSPPVQLYKIDSLLPAAWSVKANRSPPQHRRWESTCQTERRTLRCALACRDIEIPLYLQRHERCLRQTSWRRAAHCRWGLSPRNQHFICPGWWKIREAHDSSANKVQS